MKSKGKDQKSLKSSFLIIFISIFVNINFLGVKTQAHPHRVEVIPKPPTELIPSSREEIDNNLELELESSIQPWRNVSLVRSIEEYKVTVDSLVFSPNNRILISGGGSNNPQMKFFSIETGEQLTVVHAHQTGILDLAVSLDGQTLISSGEDSGINFWNLQTGEFQSTLLDHTSSVTSLAIAPDNQILVSGSLDGIRVWRLDYLPRRPLFTLAHRNNLVRAIAINPSGRLLASGNTEGKIQFWDLRKGAFFSEFSPHQEEIAGLAFSADGKNLITASRDRQIKIWDLASGQLLKTLTGHIGAIRTIALHPNGQTLASGGDDGIILWDIDKGELLTRLNDHKNWIQSLAFSSDGKYLASGGFDATVKIWQNAILENQADSLETSE